MSALIIVLPKKSLRQFLDEFSKYVLQNDEFSKCFFNMDEFSLGPAFLEPGATLPGSPLRPAAAFRYNPSWLLS